MLYHSVIAILLENVFYGTFWRLETLVLWRTTVQKLLISAYLFGPENSRAGSRKTSVTR